LGGGAAEPAQKRACPVHAGHAAQIFPPSQARYDLRMVKLITDSEINVYPEKPLRKRAVARGYERSADNVMSNLFM
jgi:hypothetical protein